MTKGELIEVLQKDLNYVPDDVDVFLSYDPDGTPRDIISIELTDKVYDDTRYRVIVIK
jgi:hypothetical protein